MPEKDLVLEFASFHEVLDNYARRLSEEGIFFATSEPRAVGSQVDFHVRIRDGFSVLQGYGEVVQTTDEGLFLRLNYLDNPSLKLLPKLLEHYRRSGVPLMELPKVKPPEEEAEEPPGDEVGSASDLEFDLAPGPESEDAVEPAETKGLTLDDLEAEFRSGAADADGAVEVEFDVDPESDEAEPEPGPILVEVEDLMDSSPEAALQVADKIEPEIEVMERGKHHEVDAGLPWLPDEPEKSTKKDVWVILLLVLLGAVLGAAFYVFVIRPNAQRSWNRTPADTLQTQANPVTALPEAVPASSRAEVGVPVEKPVPMSEAAVDDTAPDQAPESRDGPLTGVDRITWDDDSGETVVTLWADGSFLAEQVDDFRVDGEQPREVVRIRGVQRPFAPRLIELGTDHVRQLRTGLHEEDGVNSLHIVADLVDIDVELLRTEAAGEQLRVYFSRTG